MNELPSDGSLSGEESNLERANRLVEQAAAQMQQFAPPPAWRPQCVSCLNGHKIAIAELGQKLNRAGLTMEDPRYREAMQQAANFGQLLAQNPFAAIGQNGSKPDIIPAVRPADVLVNGTGLCILCFQPQKQTSLLMAPGGWTPGATK